MTDAPLNLLSRPLITAEPCGALTLPGVLAALARDAVTGFPALRPHQAMFWHMFLVQLAALTLHRAGLADMPESEDDWRELLRGLTPDFPEDEPWCLVVDDRSRPAFLQPPVPDGVKLPNDVPTADALDLLITSRNHDLKQAIARQGGPEDWIFALVALQTGEGYGGAGNHGIARMNGGSSSRALLTLAPLAGGASAKDMAPRPGAWVRRDVRLLLGNRAAWHTLDYPDQGGIGLTWTRPWPEGAQLRTRQLDIWFIEVCRRVRLHLRDGGLAGVKGTSAAARIDAKSLKGAVGDPWAPVHKTEAKSFTLAGGDFDYTTLMELLFSGTWAVPPLARPAGAEGSAGGPGVTIVAMALARGNSKTEGYRSRLIPVAGKAAIALGPSRDELHRMAKAQAEAVAAFDKALAYALVLAAAGGERERIRRDAYAFARPARDSLARFADNIFFEHLWARFEAEEADAEARRAAELAFAARLKEYAWALFDEALPTMPSPSLYRHRAEARARRALYARTLRDAWPELFPQAPQGRTASDAA